MTRHPVFPPRGSIDLIEWIGRLTERNGVSGFVIEYKQSLSLLVAPRLTMYFNSVVQSGPRAGSTYKVFMRTFDDLQEMREVISELRQRFPSINLEAPE